MLSASLPVVLLVAAMGLLSLAVFGWALLRGHLDDPEAQARAILDERDLRLRRPWETEAQRRERVRAYGAPVDPLPRDFGGGR